MEAALEHGFALLSFGDHVFVLKLVVVVVVDTLHVDARYIMVQSGRNSMVLSFNALVLALPVHDVE